MSEYKPEESAENPSTDYTQNEGGYSSSKDYSADDFNKGSYSQSTYGDGFETKIETEPATNVGHRAYGHNGHNGFATHRTSDRITLMDMFSRLGEESRTLMLLELKLAKAEIVEKINVIQRAVISMAAGSLILYAGFLTLIACACAALSLIWPVWLSTLVVGIVVCVIGGVMLGVGKSRMSSENLELRHTSQTLREEKQWVKSQVK